MAVARTRLITAALVALYAHVPGSPRRPETEEVATIAPPPASRSAGTAARIPSTTLRTFTWNSRSKRSTAPGASSGPPPPVPAFRTAASSRPHRSWASATARRLVSSDDTSPARVTTPSMPASASRPALSTSTATTRWPRSANSRVVASPMPDAAPVTSTTGWVMPVSFLRFLRGSVVPAVLAAPSGVRTARLRRRAARCLRATAGRRPRSSRSRAPAR